ncbi:sigma-70 family RNA polymerase sigma factor [Keratinibaculum paraultunense]|uniref:RNA polymerase sigma factor n=1 Tax=Keratinibaculum paraultunense TaxID=1278232 RepID=UPI00192AE2DC|nr:sigma-70 family RNA polymerase sigma factor [Keratinibaculum paraultunense]QQY79541.1 sigma-70 family RNA polymerase sigma factor [Keratinibaculum paraultunense]
MIIILFGVITDDEVDFINRIFSKMNVKMYNISFNMLKNKFDAEEAVSQTFLKIIDNIEKISALPCPQIESYCVIILKNETMNIIRKRKKIIYVENVDYFDHNEGDYDIEEEYLEKVNKEQLLSCINRLSDDEKIFIHLRFVNEMRIKDISELLGITEEAAKKRGQRILKKLRLYYEEGDISVRNS